MQLVQCSGAEPFIIDDEVADALMDLAWELATYRRYEVVRLPTRDAQSALITVTVLLGPASDLTARTATGFEPVGDELAAPELRRRAELLRWPAIDLAELTYEVDD